MRAGEMRTSAGVRPCPDAHAAAAQHSGRMVPVYRKFWLVLHIVSASAWIGVDVMVAVLVGVGAFSDDSARRGLAYQALGSFLVWPMLVSGLVCLITGLVLGLGTKWGLVRYWWVAVKLVLNVALCTLILLLLRPTMPEVAAYGKRLSAGEAVTFDVSSLIMPPVVSLTLLSVATVLSVYKPWGRIRRRPVAHRRASVPTVLAPPTPQRTISSANEAAN